MRINIAKPLIGEREITEVSRVMRSGMIACGPETKMFEEEFARFTGTDHACAVTNGTAALQLALMACGIGRGDEVITTPFTFVATVNSILSVGAIPVFADIIDSEFNLDPIAAAAAITSRTKAIMPVHLYGLAARMDEFRKIADRHDLVLIGDAAQAHGAKIGDQLVGAMAEFECFSFYPTKNMTTGEGGILTTSDTELYHTASSIRNHGRPSETLGTYEYDRFGLNLRPTDISSAIGRVQLDRLNEFNAKRSRNSAILTRGLIDVDAISLPIQPEGFTHVWHQYTILVENRDDLISHLKADDIGTGIYYPRVAYEYPHLAEYAAHCPLSEQAASTAVSLPVHAGLSEDDVEQVVSSVRVWAGV